MKNPVRKAVQANKQLSNYSRSSIGAGASSAAGAALGAVAGVKARGTLPAVVAGAYGGSAAGLGIHKTVQHVNQRNAKTGTRSARPAVTKPLSRSPRKPKRM